MNTNTHEHLIILISGVEFKKKHNMQYFVYTKASARLKGKSHVAVNFLQKKTGEQGQFRDIWRLFKRPNDIRVLQEGSSYLGGNKHC